MEIFPGFHPWEIINWSWTFSYFCWLFSNVHSITYTIVEYNSYVLLISMFMVSFFRHANLDLKHYLFIFNPKVSWFVLLFPRELFLFFHSPSVTSDCSCFFLPSYGSRSGKLGASLGASQKLHFTALSEKLPSCILVEKKKNL